MSTESRTTLKGYFNSGDVPTEANYASMIESFVHKTEDVGTYLPPAYGTAYALYPLAVAAAGTSWEYSTSVKIDSFVNAQHDHSNTANGGALSFNGVNQHTHAGTASGGLISTSSVVSFNGINQHTHGGTAFGGPVTFAGINQHYHVGAADGGSYVRTLALTIQGEASGTSLTVIGSSVSNATEYVGTATGLVSGGTSGNFSYDGAAGLVLVKNSAWNVIRCYGHSLMSLNSTAVPVTCSVYTGANGACISFLDADGTAGSVINHTTMFSGTSNSCTIRMTFIDEPA